MNLYESIKNNSLKESNWMTYQNQIENTLEAAQNDLDKDRFEEFCEGVINLCQGFIEGNPYDIMDSEKTNGCKKGDTVYWVGAGNEIGATGTIIDFPTEGRMTIKWDDGDVNTYDIDHPSIQLAHKYDNSFNETEDEKNEDSNVEDITWLLDDTDWKVDITTNERLGSDRSYRTLVKNVHDAETFNYHSDYWGSADGYQEENVNFMEQLEPYIDKVVKVTFEDGTEQKFKVLGLLIDRQYNSIGHSEILVEEVK